MKGVPQDGAKLIRLAADHGLAQAQTWLGVMYQNAEGALENYVKAHKWFNLALAVIWPLRQSAVGIGNPPYVERPPPLPTKTHTRTYVFL